MAFNNYPHVYQPLQVGTMHLKNRIQYSPIVSNHAGYIDGMMNSELFEFLSYQAKTGASLVTVGSTPVDFEEGRDFFGCMSATDDLHIAGLASAAREVHRQGCNLSAELTHAGQWAAPLLPEGQRAFVPSLNDGMDPAKFVAIGRKEMDIVIQHHIDATRRCMAAGFDQVMVHMAHGNLLSAFLSPAFNSRTDEYGGSFENRIRFVMEVLEAVHDTTQDKIPIEIRFVGNEWIPNGMPMEERIEFLKLAQKYIDMVVVSAGTLMRDDVVHKNMPGYYVEPMLSLDYAAAFKEACPELCISVSGGFSTLEQAEWAISEGKCDMVAMAKSLIAEPDFVNKGARGQEDQIRPCMRCMYCMRDISAMGHLEGCAVNPVFGWEYRGTKLTPIAKPRKAMIVGGGPGGLEATRVLTERNFDVVLHEADSKLGGRMHEASALSFKDGFRRYLDWSVRTAEECGATIKLNSKVTADTIREENPDIVILACGTDLINPPIPGIDGENVMDVVSVDRSLKTPGQRVVVCGGGLSGVECGLGLAMDGREVTVIDMVPTEDFYQNFTFFLKAALTEKLDEAGVVRRGNCKVKEFTAEGVVVINEQGEEELLPCDTAVTAFGVKANQAMIEELSNVVPETYLVGDCTKVGVIGDAINQAYWICRDL